jgi:putative iron-only hydrogenase system regulator
MNYRIGVIGIVIEDLSQIAEVNDILHQYGNIIVGRMGIPYRRKNINIISLAVDGTTDQIGALTGKLGKINGLNVKSALSKKIFNEDDENEKV